MSSRILFKQYTIETVGCGPRLYLVKALIGSTSHKVAGAVLADP